MIDRTITKVVTVGNSGISGDSVSEGVGGVFVEVGVAVSVGRAVTWVVEVGDVEGDGDCGDGDCVGVPLGFVDGEGVGVGDCDGKGIADKLAEESVPYVKLPYREAPW
jgi:hypothetical protein